MRYSSDIKPVSYIKTHIADILKKINETHRPVVITQNGEAKAILQDPESYEKMKKAIALLKIITQGENDIKQGNIKAQDKVFSDLEASILNINDPKEI